MSLSGAPPDLLGALAAEVAIELGRGHIAEPHDRWHDTSDAWYVLFEPRKRPFHGMAKVMLEQDETRTLAGFYFEKGLGGDAPVPTMVMKPDWRWFDLLPKFRDGSLGRALEAGAAAAGLTPTVLVAAAVPGVRNGMPRFPYRRFALRDGRLLLEDSGPTHPEIVDLPAASDFPSLCDAIEGIPRSEWFWVDVILGAITPSHPAAGDELAALVRPFRAYL